MRTATALHPAARAILWLDVVVAFGSGLILFAFARDADTSFAWTIKAPMTAAFLGAGAGAMATWLAAFAAGAAWTLREADWRRVRIAFPVSIAFLVLLLVAALRFSEAFDGGAWQTWTWIGAIVLSIGLLTVGALQQELVSRRRAVETAAAAEPA